MLSRLSIQEVSRHLEEYVHKVEDQNEGVLLTRDGRPVAELRPLPKLRRISELPELLASLPRLSEEEAASFATDLDAARAEIAGAPHNPWER